MTVTKHDAAQRRVVLVNGKQGRVGVLVRVKRGKALVDFGAGRGTYPVRLVAVLQGAVHE